MRPILTYILQAGLCQFNGAGEELVLKRKMVVRWALVTGRMVGVNAAASRGCDGSLIYALMLGPEVWRARVFIYACKECFVGKLGEAGSGFGSCFPWHRA